MSAAGKSIPFVGPCDRWSPVRTVEDAVNFVLDTLSRCGLNLASALAVIEQASSHQPIAKIYFEDIRDPFQVEVLKRIVGFVVYSPTLQDEGCVVSAIINALRQKCQEGC